MTSSGSEKEGPGRFVTRLSDVTNQRERMSSTLILDRVNLVPHGKKSIVAT